MAASRHADTPTRRCRNCCRSRAAPPQQAASPQTEVKDQAKAHRRALLVTCDAAGASHELIDWLVRQNHAADRCVEFSVGFDVDADVRAAIAAVRPDCWAPALDTTDGTTRQDADFTESPN